MFDPPKQPVTNDLWDYLDSIKAGEGKDTYLVSKSMQLLGILCMLAR